MESDILWKLLKRLEEVLAALYADGIYSES